MGWKITFDKCLTFLDSDLSTNGLLECLVGHTLQRCCGHAFLVSNRKRICRQSYIMNEISDVAGVGQTGSDGKLRLGDDGPLIHSANSRRFIDDVVQRLGLLQLAQVIVLERERGGKCAILG